jgi:hypothetical protein
MFLFSLHPYLYLPSSLYLCLSIYLLIYLPLHPPLHPPLYLPLPGLGTSPSASVKLDFGKIEDGDFSPGGRPLAGADRRDVPARRRR